MCDRYLDSSVAYQGIARGLGEDKVRDLSLTVTGGLLPERTFLLLVDAAVPFEKQDLSIADLAAKEGRALVIALSKWDLIEDRGSRLGPNCAARLLKNSVSYQGTTLVGP